jgi:hypothetical protein
MPGRFVLLSEEAREALCRELWFVPLVGDASVTELDPTPETADQRVARLLERATVAVEQASRLMRREARLVTTIWLELVRAADAREVARSLVVEARQLRAMRR